MVSRPSTDPSSGPSRVVNMLEAKTHLSRLVEAIETGATADAQELAHRCSPLRAHRPPCWHRWGVCELQGAGVGLDCGAEGAEAITDGPVGVVSCV